MADIPINTSIVFKGALASPVVATSFDAIEAGMPVGRNADGTFSQVSATSPLAGCSGIALCNCASGQPFVYVEKDNALDIGLFGGDSGKNIYVSPSGGLTFDIPTSSGSKVMTIGNVNADGSVTLQILNGATIP